MQPVMTNNGTLNFAFELTMNLGGLSNHLSDMLILKKKLETCTHYLCLDSCISCISFKLPKNFIPFKVLADTLKAGIRISSNLIFSWESIIGSNINSKDDVSCLYNGSGGGGLI
jgi:hypothetical protein